MSYNIGGYIGDYIGSITGVIKGDTRSLDYGSCNSRAEHRPRIVFPECRFRGGWFNRYLEAPKHLVPLSLKPGSKFLA